MKAIDSTGLSEWLTSIATTEDDEFDCDALFAIVEEAVDAVVAGADLRTLLPLVAAHIQHCPDCRDFYDTLVALTSDAGEPAG